MKNEDIYKRLGSALRKAREDQFLTQVEVAEELGVHYSTIQYRESGKRKMNIDDLELHCKAIGIEDWITFMTDVLKED